jgi:hypothetical protein
MDHDLTGMLDNPNIKLDTAQVKQYSKQLLEGTCYLHAVSLSAGFVCETKSNSKSGA